MAQAYLTVVVLVVMEVNRHSTGNAKSFRFVFLRIRTILVVREAGHNCGLYLGHLANLAGDKKL